MGQFIDVLMQTSLENTKVTQNIQLSYIFMNLPLLKKWRHN